MSDLRNRLLEKAIYLNKTEVYVDEWDETVYIQELSAKQLSDFTKSTYKESENGELEADPMSAMVNILYASLVDEDGNRLFNKGELKQINGVVLLRLGSKALDLSGLSNVTSVQDAVEALKKAQESDSPTD
jgi:hypothetical protein